MDVVATPHTRGSTLPEPVRATMAMGYPAYAGIDLWRKTTRFTTRWLPRIRGDRPLANRQVGSSASATPHTRGSTPLHRFFRPHFVGYPAYAGIDLFQSMHRNVVQQLPRKRGEFSFHSNWLSFQGILLL